MIFALLSPRLGLLQTISQVSRAKTTKILGTHFTNRQFGSKSFKNICSSITDETLAPLTVTLSNSDEIESFGSKLADLIDCPDVLLLRGENMSTSHIDTILIYLALELGSIVLPTAEIFILDTVFR